MAIRESSNARAVVSMPAPAGMLGLLQRFGLFGSVAGLVDYGAVLLALALGARPELARALSFVLGSATAYLLNRRWTFRSRRDTRELVLVATGYALSFLIVSGINALTLAVLSASWWEITCAWVLSQAAGTAFNFTVQHCFVFGATQGIDIGSSRV